MHLEICFGEFASCFEILSKLCKEKQFSLPKQFFEHLKGTINRAFHVQCSQCLTYSSCWHYKRVNYCCTSPCRVVWRPTFWDMNNSWRNILFQTSNKFQFYKWSRFIELSGNTALCSSSNLIDWRDDLTWRLL